MKQLNELNTFWKVIIALFVAWLPINTNYPERYDPNRGHYNTWIWNNNNY